MAARNPGAGNIPCGEPVFVIMISLNPHYDKLAEWWTLNETSGIRVASHNGNDLTDNNTVTSAAGKKGNAAQFTNATNEYLSAADSVSLRITNIDFTI